MSLKYQMTSKGMQSMFTLAWQGADRPARDPMFNAPSVEAEEVEAEAALLNATFVAPGRVAPLEEAVRAQAERDRLIARREIELLRLGYTGF